MSAAVDHTMTMERFLDIYGDTELNNTTSEEVLSALEMLESVAPDLVYEVSMVSIPFDGYDLEVSHVHTPEGDLIVSKDYLGFPSIVTYVGTNDADFIHQMVVDAITITRPIEESDIGMMSFDTEEELIEFLSHLDIEVPEDWYI